MDRRWFKIAKTISLFKRMGCHMSLTEAQNCINDEYGILTSRDEANNKINGNDKLNDSNKDVDTHQIENVSIDELKRQYIDYNLFRNICSHDNPLYTIKEDKEDGSSRPLGEVQNAMVDKYQFHDWQFIIRQGRNNIEVCLVIPLLGDNVQMVKKDMDKFGYFCSHEDEYRKENLVYLMMKFEPMYQDNVSNIIREYEFLYHATPTENIPQIMSQGITPKSQNNLFSYPERVFLIKGDVTEEGQNLIAQNLFRFSDRKETEIEYTILTIDVDSIPKNIPFYFDPNHEHGVFTNETIPSSCIVSQRNVIVKKRNHS